MAQKVTKPLDPKTATKVVEYGQKVVQNGIEKTLENPEFWKRQAEAQAVLHQKGVNYG